MKIQTTEVSPQVYARIGGALYLLIIIIGFCTTFFVREKLVVSGDITATANNLMASQSLWRVGIAADLIMHVSDIPLMLVIYVLLRPVSKNLALLAVLFNLIQTAVLTANKFNLFSALFPLGSADYLKAFEPNELYTQAYQSLKLYDYGVSIGLIFFGFVCLVQGYLIFRSGYFPKTIGILMMMAGLSYLTNSFTLILAPAYAPTILPILALALIGELSFCLWLIVKGVNVTKWENARLNLPELTHAI